MVLPVNDEDWVQIFPAGTTVGRDGRGPYILDDAEAVIAASASKVDLFIDRDHAADLAAKGTPVTAAGWIKELKADENGIHARIDWTPPAKEQLKNREYRYISPTFLHERGTGRVTRILRASLTNDPNFEMKAVAAVDRTFSQPTKELTMDQLAQDLAALLGLTGDSVSADAIVEAVKNLQAVIDGIKTGFEVPAEAITADDIVAAIKDKQSSSTATAAVKKGEVDPKQYVPVTVMKEMQDELATLKNERAQEKATAAVEGALKVGKILPAQKDWALGVASKDLAEFDKYIAAAPVLIQNSGLGNYTVDTAAAQSGLTQEQSRVAAILGVAPDAMKAQIKQSA